ncbi:heme-binding domain-containing protein [Dyadobacter sp. CY345]|uniref:heme-binding domain-containing protein n=1 Tax=Dyadobacter sp. CY345 TaxID=2909335 RepID=UPI001F1E9F60|nr:heme-binding domain-containing protein [Dyadobacter sp. CY345]MCF2446657.1 heme-binding domain-containing protein [Dyadobacter sp. CY345]
MNFFQSNSSRKLTGIILIILFAGLIGMQVATPSIQNPAVSGEFKAPKEIKSIFERSCYDCHSNETKLQWFDKLAPFSYMVAADVREARKRYNFSTWDSISPADQEVKLWYMVNMIEAGKMPLPQYTAVHRKARITDEELSLLKTYVTQLSHRNHGAGDTAKIKVVNKSIASRPKSINGISYFDDYKSWKVIASTNRLDNGTMRLVYGNDITVKAINEKTINPWPDGAIIVKVVWNMQPEDGEGTTKPGNFNNVQMMIKDSKKFTDTEGWGFARFNGLELKPYGNTVAFAVSCINCHRLVSKNGFVFDIPTRTPELAIK